MKKIKNLHVTNDRTDAYDVMLRLSNTVVNANKKSGKSHSLKVEQTGKLYTVWLIQD
jgi:hypothetical protein